MKKIISLLVLSLVMGAASYFDDGIIRNKKTLAVHDDLLVISHRGASAYAPEHTIASYEIAKELGEAYIEIDIQMTKDGVLVAMHDNTVDRTTNGTGLVNTYTLEDLKKLDAGSWFNEQYEQFQNSAYNGLSIPTLDEIFDHFGKSINYYIEVKDPDINPEIETKLMNLLKKYDLLEPCSSQNCQVVVQSFHENALQKVHRLNQNIPLVQLIKSKDVSSISTENLRKWKEYSMGIGMNYKTVDKKIIKKILKEDLQIHVYTVNNEKDMEKFIKMGVHGIITDTPDKLVNINQ